MVNNKHLIHYVPLGINISTFKPINKNHENIVKLKKAFFGDNQYNFVIGFISKNMHRKKIGNLILGYRHFCNMLKPEDAKKCVLVLHTDPMSKPGYNLIEIAKTLCKDYPVVIENNKMSQNMLCALYNMFDIYINCSSAEGFGLGVAEAMSCGIPVCATVTGGLQDQLGFVDENNKPIKFTCEFSTNSVKKYTTHGPWAYPLYPETSILHGTLVTPYINECYVDYKTIAKGIMYWYTMDNKKRKECGLEGRKWVEGDGNLSSIHMCNEFTKAIEYTIDNFKPNKKFDIYTYNDFYNRNLLPNNCTGILSDDIKITNNNQHEK